MTRHVVVGLLAAAGVLMLASGCSRQGTESTAYQAACHGPRLGTPANREKALQEGYEIHPKYDCVAKASYEVVRDQRAKAEADNAPREMANREAEEIIRRRELDAQRDADLQSDREAEHRRHEEMQRQRETEQQRD